MLNSSSPIESTDISKTYSEIPTEGSERDSLPRGSGLLLETILMLSRRIGQGEDLKQIREDAASIEDMAGELVGKWRRQVGAV